VAQLLAVWLYGEKVATVDQDRQRRPRLTYTSAVLSRYPFGTPLLSLKLPVQPEQHSHRVVLPFLDGLLPEGLSRSAVAHDLNVVASDSFALIRSIGRDCAGAVVVQPDDLPPPPPASTLRAEPLSDVEIAALVANLRTAPLGIDDRVRVSLGGVQEKLLLTQLPNGSWGRPVDGTPSTHILKPEIPRFPNSVENEAFCMRIAQHLGVSVAQVDIILIGGRKLLAVERYDRSVDRDGSVERIHQEDFCQATSTEPSRKYQEDGGPSLRSLAEILEAYAAAGSNERLLQTVTVIALIGNGDAHAKNFSLLHHPTGELTLAPLYDLMSTLDYGDDHLAMQIDGVKKTNRLTASRIVSESVGWGLRRADAIEIVDGILGSAPIAIATAHDETEGLPTTTLETVLQQLAQLRSVD